MSLTSVSCKIMEHIICSHIHKHLDRHSILSKFQYGFRRKHSCEAQLLITTHDLASLRDRGTQVDMAILDFSKAFDTVPHNKLLHKLKRYGVGGSIHAWVASFLKQRDQCVVVDGQQSNWVHVDSGVPQGTVLGPLLFLLHINDLPDSVSSTTRLFADDCLIYRPINSVEDQLELQRDLDSLQEWSERWGMRFNPGKCNVMRINRGKNPHERYYSLCGVILAQVTEAKYLGVTISQDLEWSSHVAGVATKASRSLGFIQRNLKECPVKLKETAFLALVRSVLEYSCPIWDPHFQKDIIRLEKVQRKGARVILKDYDPYSSVTAMLDRLGWESLQERRRELRLALLYKIVHGLVVVPTEEILQKSDSRTRKSHQYTHRHIHANTDCFKFSFFPRTVPEFNKVTSETVESGTLHTFKSRLKKERV